VCCRLLCSCLCLSPKDPTYLVSLLHCLHCYTVYTVIRPKMRPAGRSRPGIWLLAYSNSSQGGTCGGVSPVFSHRSTLSHFVQWSSYIILWAPFCHLHSISSHIMAVGPFGQIKSSLSNQLQNVCNQILQVSYYDHANECIYKE